MNPAPLITTTLAAALIGGSQLLFNSPDLVSPVYAQEIKPQGILVAPVSFQDTVPVRELESLTFALTPPDASLRAHATLQETTAHTTVEVSLYSDTALNPSEFEPQLRLASCDQVPNETFSLAAFNQRARSETDLDLELNDLALQTEAVSVAVVHTPTQVTVGCHQL